jgi:hypothetical protein
MTREEWLLKATEQLKPAFLETGAEIPEKVRVTCGWPSHGGRGTKKRVTGECWPAKKSRDAHFEIFISPTMDNPIEVLGTLIHELVHAAVGLDQGHKAAFRTAATALGLTGKMTATEVGEELEGRLHDLSAKLGDYPHAELDPTQQKKPQSTRMLKIQCPACGWMARTSKKWMELGLPTCACGEQMINPDAQAAEILEAACKRRLTPGWS